MGNGILGIIPARYGSSEVKLKNIRPLAGLPLLAWTVRAALGSRLDRVILSTDHPDIAEIGKSIGVEVPFLRPPEFATSEAKAIDVVLHSLDFFARSEGWAPEAMFYLQPTSPFRETYHIDQGIAALRNSGRDSVISMAAVIDHPLHLYWRNGGDIAPVLPGEPMVERRQDLRPVVAINNAIMGSRTEYIKKQQFEHGLIVNLEDFVPQFIEAPVSIDINSEIDFIFADLLMSRMMERQSVEKVRSGKELAPRYGLY